MTKGFVLTLDALLALMLFVLVLVTVPHEPETPDFTELVVFQKIHDLQKIWSYAGSYNFDEMVSDTAKVFPANDFNLRKNGQTHSTSNQTNAIHSVSSCFEPMTPDGPIDSICLTVHY